jgi:hypothetical protein
MRWAALSVVLAVLAAPSAGCLRRRYDLCAEIPPHPECPFDGAVSADAALDAGVPDDAPPSDAARGDAAGDAP